SPGRYDQRHAEPAGRPVGVVQRAQPDRVVVDDVRLGRAQVGAQAGRAANRSGPVAMERADLKATVRPVPARAGLGGEELDLLATTCERGGQVEDRLARPPVAGLASRSST